MSTQYKHSQPGYLSIVISLILIVVSAITYAFGPKPVGMLLGLTGIFCLVFSYKLTVEIGDGSLRFWFGPGIFWKNIPLERIMYCQPFKGVIFGWGIHFGPGGWLYNVSGMKAVTVVLKSGRKLHIGTDEPQQFVEAVNSAMHGRVIDKADQMWCEAKTDYLKRVEQALSAARHPRSFEILADVSSHLDRRFAELEQQQRTWECFQKIITEMGPPSDFTDLIGQDKKSGRWIFTKTELGAISIVLVAFGLSVYYYPQMPERMACHWDLHGQVNGYMPKPMGMLIMPGVLLAIVASFIILPRVV
jgi:hypothetical protein